jgi:predicted nucleic acid-binding protein
VTGFILDCSVTMVWCLPDEHDPAADALMEACASDGATVPALWFWETGNVLLQAVRRGRLTSEDARRQLDRLAALPIVADNHSTGVAWANAFDLAAEHRQTVYDAAYLELAMRRELPLATIDRALKAAAGSNGDTVLP